MSAYPFVPLAEVATVQSGYAFRSSDWTKSGVPVLKISNILPGMVELEGCGFVDETTAVKAERFAVDRGDSLIAMSGASVGKVGRVRFSERALINQRVGRFSVLDPAKLDPDFLYYFLQLPATFDYLTGAAYGSAQPNISPSLILDAKIPLPSLSEQRLITNLLCPLDDKIAANTNLAASATSLAFHLYEESLVRTESLSRRLDEIAINKPGKYLAKSDYEAGGEYYVYGSNSVMGKHSEYLVEGAFTVLAKIGSYCGNLRWSQRPAWVNNNASAIVAKDSIDPWILGQALLRVDMQEHRAGTGQPYIRMDSLFSSYVTIPNEEIGRRIAPRLKELAEVSTKHLEESELLAQIRDALLPPLMSGKLRVQDAEEVLEGVL